MIYIYDPSVWPAEAADAAARGKYQCYSTTTTPLPTPSHYTYLRLFIEDCDGPVGSHAPWKLTVR